MRAYVRRVISARKERSVIPQVDDWFFPHQGVVGVTNTQKIKKS